jgi:flavin reductase (DIM6/NTAB) family NADH-FMN oxidoreductase RutF
MPTTEVDAETFKAAMGSFAAGVTIVTTIDPDGTPQAVTATAFSSVSLDPPLCLVCIDFASSVEDRFAEVAWYPGEVTGCPLIEDALAFMECEVVEVHSGGDHDIFLGRPSAIEVRDGSPLVYWRGSYSSLPPPPELDSGVQHERQAL